MLTIFRILFRLSLLCAHVLTGAILAFILLTRPIQSLGLFNPKLLIRRWLFIASYFTGCRISSTITPLKSPTLLISNHISWLDILVLGGSYELHFLSKEEVKQWPIIGFLTVISGTLLMKRGVGSQEAINDIQATLQRGDNVALFPEGTTSSGFATKLFHSRLFKAAYANNTPISITSLSYSTNDQTRDENMGWRNQSFWQHVIYVLSQKRTYVKVNLVRELTDFHTMPRKELATKCKQLIDDDLQRNHYPCQ